MSERIKNRSSHHRLWPLDEIEKVPVFSAWKHSKIFKDSRDSAVSLCSSKRQICPKIITDDALDGTRLKIHNHFFCRTLNAVYGIRCAKCECTIVYVWETERSMGERLKVGHKRSKAVFSILIKRK